MQEKLNIAIKFRIKRDFENSEKIFLELLINEPKNCLVSYHYAWLQDLQGNEEKAIKYYLLAIENGLKGNDLADCMFGLGSSYRMMKEYDKSIEVFKKAIKQFPKKYELKLFLSFTYFDKGKYKNAYVLLLKTLAKTNKNKGIEQYRNVISTYIKRIKK